MPDLSTHLFIGIALALLLRLESREEGCLIVVGAMIVDIERPFSLLVQSMGIKFLGLTIPFHSLLGIFLLSLSVSTLFELEEIRLKDRFMLLLLGSGSHLVADMTLHPWQEKGIFLLFPLKIPFSFNLFWPGYIGYPLLGIIFCLIALIWYNYKKSRDNMLHESYNL